MPRRIVFHAGFHKTGTSTVQAFLRENRKTLMPHLAIRLKGQMTSLIHATRGYSTWKDPLTLDKATRRFDNLLKDLPGMPRRVLCLSAEELSGHMPGREAVPDYSAAAVLLYEFVTMARARFPDASLAILLGTRGREAWLRSAWGEHVKSSGLTDDLDSFMARHTAAGDLAVAARDVTTRVPCPVLVHALEDSTDLPFGPATPLLDLCEIPLRARSGLTVVPAANPALDAETLAACLEINRTHPNATTRQAAKAALLSQGSR